MKAVKKLNVFLGSSLVAIGLLGTSYVQAQTAPVVCPGYERGKTQIPGQRVGKKVQAAFEAYSADLIDEALEILRDIDTNQEYDRAFVDRFLGNLLAAQEGQAQNALDYLMKAASSGLLNDGDQATTLRLVADLNMQERNYSEALKWYQEWMTFTCKEDADVYTRLAQAYFETKELAKMIAPADKAIQLYEKPNKNPYVLKLTSYYERKMYPETIAVAEMLVKLFPDTKQWWSQLGFFYMLVEDYEKALETFSLAYTRGYLEKASEIRALAQLYNTNGIPHQSATLQEKHIASGLLKNNESNLLRMANAWQRARHYDKAAKYYGDAAKLTNDGDHYRKQGTLLLSAEKYPQAIAALQKALDLDVEDQGSVHMAMMEAYFYQGKFKQAHFHVTQAKKDKDSRRNASSWEPYIKEKAKNRGIKI